MKTFKLFFLAVLFQSAAMGATEGYLVDGEGNVVKNAYGECWRTGYWTEALAIEECDPSLFKKPEPISEPKSELKPVPEVKPVPMQPVRLNAEALFDFDQSKIRPDGKKALDEKILAGAKSSSQPLLITGHADRIGSAEYNQKLSERRANSVRDYLVEQGLSAKSLTVLGRGESEPDPAADTAKACRGMRGAVLIRCLQPDRRVTVEPGSTPE